MPIFKIYCRLFMYVQGCLLPQSNIMKIMLFEHINLTAFRLRNILCNKERCYEEKALNLNTNTCANIGVYPDGFSGQCHWKKQR